MLSHLSSITPSPSRILLTSHFLPFAILHYSRLSTLLQGDLGEFNQCQGQLRDLYKHGLPGHVMEFLGYRILYLLFSKNRAGAFFLFGLTSRFGADLLSPLSYRPRLPSLHPTFSLPPVPRRRLPLIAELNNTLASLTDTETQDPSVSHALAVRLAVTQGNYAKLFRLFMAAPKMGAYIMDHFVERERIAALVTMTKA